MSEDTTSDSEGSLTDTSDSGACTDLDGEEDDEKRDPCAFQAPCKQRAFSCEQVSSLKTFYKQGMVGVGKKYDGLIHAASQESGLNVKQVKVSLLL